MALRRLGLRLPSLLILIPACNLSHADALSNCQLPGIAEPAKCGVAEVPENPAKPDGRKIGISVAMVPATQGRALPDPIVLLMAVPERTPSARLLISPSCWRRCAATAIFCSSTSAARASHIA